MLTPGYSLTATERILPSMALDFTTGVLDPRITFTRALDTATRTNASGLIEVVNANLPRFDYDPVTLAPRGLLIEASLANLFLRSNGFSTTVTWLGQPTVGTAVAASGTSPDGTNNAFLYIPSTGAVSHDIQQIVTASAVTYTMSLYAKPGGYDFLYMGYFDGVADRQAYFNVSTGAVSSSSGSPSPVITPAGNGWYRCSITFTGAVGRNSFGFCGVPSNGGRSTPGNGTSGVLIYGAQLEAGTTPSSYIPTTTTSLTRNNDVAVMTGTNFSSWYSATQGTFVCTGRTYAPADGRTLFDARFGGAAQNVITLYQSAGTPVMLVASGGATQALIAPSGSVSANTTFKLCGALKQNDFAASLNGGAISTDTAGLMPVGLDRCWIGCAVGAANFLNGHVEKISYWSQRITNAEILAFSKL
jgi:hypothetical protein